MKGYEMPVSHGAQPHEQQKLMKAYAMLSIGKAGWIEKERPVCGPMDAIVKPLAVAPCTSDIHTVWEGAIGDRKDMILGHEGCGEVVEVGALVKDFKVGDRVLIPAITPDWNSLEAQAGFAMHSGGLLGGWKFSNFKDGVFAEYCHVNDAGTYVNTVKIVGIDASNKYLWLDSSLGITPTASDKLYPGEGAAESTSTPGSSAVYASLFLGREAYGIIDPDGGGLRMIYKSASDIGGPLEQFSTAGYKFSTGTKILYQERMVRVESCSRYSLVDTTN